MPQRRSFKRRFLIPLIPLLRGFHIFTSEFDLAIVYFLQGGGRNEITNGGIHNDLRETLAVHYVKSYVRKIVGLVVLSVICTWLMRPHTGDRKFPFMTVRSCSESIFHLTSPSLSRDKQLLFDIL